MSEELHPGLHPGLHPDADALNAFIEGVLPEHERAECLTHLAQCAECRDVVFLARQAAELEAPAPLTEAPVSLWRRLFRPMPVLAAAAAAFLMFFTIAVHRMIRSAEPQPQVTASAKLPVETVPLAKAEQVAPAPRTTVRKVNRRPVLTAQAVVPAAPPPPPPPAPVTPAAPVEARAGVTGTIIDPAGAVIPSARVELKNDDTGTTYASTSDAHGNYNIAGLAPGRYDFSVTSTGFKKFVRPGVSVQPQELARLDAPLEVGQTTETITVNEEAPLLKTESGEISHQVNSTATDALPPFVAGTGNVRSIVNASPPFILPDASTPVNVATKNKLVVALDSAGGILFSEDAGKTWTRVKPKWKGKIVRLVLNANAAFELTTDPASTWISTDGRHWSKARPSR